MGKLEVSRRAVLAAGGLAGLTAAASAAAAAGRSTDVVAQTTAGRIKGSVEGPVKAFRGVPYGAPTSGANRFKPPQPVEPWTAVRNAKTFGHISPQPVMKVIPEEVDSQAHEPQGEDCLMLNVWTPALDGRKRPVMVWHHGGGYAVGGGSGPWYDGARLAAKHDVVVVTHNHRLNVFGYLYLAEIFGPEFADSGNVGMLDCVAALRWVRDNISGFGGDPDNVTVFGESGGAGKVSTLLGMPPAVGLFHRAIAQSGAAIRQIPPAQATRTTKALLEKLGVGRGDVARLQAIPADDLIAALGAGGLGSFGFGPVRDGRSIPKDVFDPVAPSISAGVPLMMGSNLTESTFVLSTPLEPMDEPTLHDQVKGYIKSDDAGADKVIAAYRKANPGRDEVFLFHLISSDVWMRNTVLEQAGRKAAQGKAPIYVYQFDKLSPARGGKLHCPHGMEIPFAFDNLAKAKDLTPPGPKTQALADRMSSAWTSFARTGRPAAPGLPAWPAYEPKRRAVMVLDDVSRVELDPGAKPRAVLAEVTKT